jgi:hypothetical protein
LGVIIPSFAFDHLAHKPAPRRGGVRVHISHGELTTRNLEFNSMTGCCARCSSASLKLVMLCSTRAMLNRSFVCVQLALERCDLLVRSSGAFDELTARVGGLIGRPSPQPVCNGGDDLGGFTLAH